MGNLTTLPTKADQTHSIAPAADANRRRLLQGGLAAAPVLMTLVSRPVLGQVGCQTASAAVSGNLSRGGLELPVCVGASALTLASNQSLWPPGYYPDTVNGPNGHKATKFHEHGLGFQGNKRKNDTILEVLKSGDNFDSNMAAALLNAAAGRTPVLSVADVQGIWSEVMSKGYFEPTGGARWYENDIISYLKTTMPM